MTTATRAIQIDNVLLAGMLSACAPLVGDHAPELETLRANLLRQHRENRRIILVHGAYNAGKSTLINALLSEERAAVRDIPTTASVDRYDCGRLELLDTPGVNAPIEDEEIAERALRSAHLVMFVVREGDQDVADVYRRLFKLLESDRSVMLVFNHQASDVGQIEQQRKRLLELLVRQAEEMGVADSLLDNVTVVPVNARLGLRGRLENRPLFVQASGLEDLENQLAAWLERAEAAQPDYLARRALNDLFQPLSRKLQSMQGDTGALNEVNQQLGILGAQIDRLQSDLHLQAAAQVKRSKAEIGRILDDSADRPELFESRIQELGEAAQKALLESMSNGLLALDQQLEHSHRAVSIAPPDIAQLAGDSNGMAGQVTSVVTEAGKTGLRKVGEDELLVFFKWLRTKKAPWFKGRWEKTLGRWAGRSAIALQLAVGAAECYGDIREERKANEARRSAELQRQQIIEEIARSIEAAQNAFISEQLDLARDRLLAPLHDERSRITAGYGELGEHFEQLSLWIDELQSLASEQPA